MLEISKTMVLNWLLKVDDKKCKEIASIFDTYSNSVTKNGKLDGDEISRFVKHVQNLFPNVAGMITRGIDSFRKIFKSMNQNRKVKLFPGVSLTGNIIEENAKKMTEVFDRKGGYLEEEDFLNAFKKTSDEAALQELENLYLIFLKDNGKATVSGNIATVEAEIPTGVRGKTIKLSGTFDNTTGKLVMSQKTTLTKKNGVTSADISRTEYCKNEQIETNVTYEYSNEILENFVINDAKDHKGNPIKTFRDIPAIRKMHESQRTEEQKELLKEFDNLIEMAINIGNEYGIDPKLVLSIIEEEVRFDGLGLHGVNPVSGAGKGYMQMTSVVLLDYLGADSKSNLHADKNGNFHARYKTDYKSSVFGSEFEELLESRGFHVKDAKTNAQKNELMNQIWAYLKTNEDPEFNIALGTLTLRVKMNASNGNVKTAARNYNGSSTKESYAKRVSSRYQALENQCANDSTYRRAIVKR